jgi:hypothetical protein
MRIVDGMYDNKPKTHLDLLMGKKHGQPPPNFGGIVILYTLYYTYIYTVYTYIPIISLCIPIDFWLVISTPLKNMTISWDYDIPKFPNIWNNKKSSKPPTRCSLKPMWLSGCSTPPHPHLPLGAALQILQPFTGHLLRRREKGQDLHILRRSRGSLKKHGDGWRSD